MSGGHFSYNQYKIFEIAEELRGIIDRAESDDAEGYERYLPETLDEFRRGYVTLMRAYVYAQRIDWLVSGDDGEDSFIRRLHDELAKIDKGER